MKGKPRVRSAAKTPTKGNTSAPASAPSGKARKGTSSSTSTSGSPTYQVTDYEWLPVGKFKRHVCCDCGLTHKVKYRIHDGSMQEQWTRDEKETAKERVGK